MQTHHPREMPDRRSSYSFRFPAECCRSRRAAAKAPLRAALPGSRRRRSDAPRPAESPDVHPSAAPVPHWARRRAMPAFGSGRACAAHRLPRRSIAPLRPAAGRQIQKAQSPRCIRGIPLLSSYRPPSAVPCSPPNGSMPPYISISSIICVNGDSVKFSVHETAKKSAETVQLRKNCRFLSNGSSSFILF